MHIAGREIHSGCPPYIIAEMSGNHNQSLERALAIIDAAADAGVDAVKLQTYTADTMTLNIQGNGFTIEDPTSPWHGRTLYDLYDEAHTPWEWHQPLFEHGRRLGVAVFSSPFDESAVDFLESLNAPAYKIASFENTDLPLIRKAAATGKPLIVSTGMASVSELDETVRTARTAGCKDIALLKCTSTYPAAATNSNLRTIPNLAEMLGLPCGLSDHSRGVGVALAAVALGAVIIEKHLTLSRAEGGVDAAFSLEPPEMKMLVEETRRAWESLGDIAYGTVAAEKRSITFRRSLYVTADMQRGDVLTRDNLRAIRPGYGLPPKYIDMLLNKRVKRDVERGTPADWSIVE